MPIYILCWCGVSSGDLLCPGLENCHLKLLNWILMTDDRWRWQSRSGPIRAKCRRHEARRWEHPKMYAPKLCPGLKIQSRSAARRDLGMIMMILILMVIIMMISDQVHPSCISIYWPPTPLSAPLIRPHTKLMMMMMMYEARLYRRVGILMLFLSLY